jgi:hypothetical protein
MKLLLPFFVSILLLITPLIEAQKSSNPTEKLSLSKQTNADTIKSKIKIEPFQLEVLTPKETESNNKPWIIALVVGFLTFIATIIASLVNRCTSIKTIQTNKEIAVHQFNSTLKTKNRQDWIDNLRNAVSMFISNCVKVNIEFQDPSENTKDKVKEIHEKIILNRTKLQLLLNPEKEFHNSLLTSITEFIDILDKHTLNFENNMNDYDNEEFRIAHIKIVENARILLYSEWQKIQKITKDS